MDGWLSWGGPELSQPVIWIEAKMRRERERETLLTSKQSPSSMRTQQQLQHHRPIRVFHCHCHCIFFIGVVSGWSTITSEGGIGDWRLEIGKMTQEKEEEEEVRRELWSARSGREMASSSSTSIRMRWTASVRGDDGASATRSSGDSTKSPVTTCTNLKTAFHDCFNRCVFALSRHVISFSCYCQRWKIEFPFLMVNDVDGVCFCIWNSLITRWPSVENVS